MQANPFTHKSLFRSSGGKLLTDQYSGAFMNGIKQSVLLTGLLGVAVAPQWEDFATPNARPFACPLSERPFNF
jgi:hypothetical protein